MASLSFFVLTCGSRQQVVTHIPVYNIAVDNVQALVIKAVPVDNEPDHIFREISDQEVIREFLLLIDTSTEQEQPVEILQSIRFIIQTTPKMKMELDFDFIPASEDDKRVYFRHNSWFKDINNPEYRTFFISFEALKDWCKKANVSPRCFVDASGC